MREYKLTHGKWAFLGKWQYMYSRNFVHYIFLRLGDQAECREAKNAAEWPKDLKSCVLLSVR